VPQSGAFVVAPVHRSYVDFLLAGSPWGVRPVHGEVVGVRGRLDRPLPVRDGRFPVERDAADFTAIRTCEALLAAGEPVVVFPRAGARTATRWSTCSTARVHGDAATVPIIPIGIGGSDAPCRAQQNVFRARS